MKKTKSEQEYEYIRIAGVCSMIISVGISIMIIQALIATLLLYHSLVPDEEQQRSLIICIIAGLIMIFPTISSYRLIRLSSTPSKIKRSLIVSLLFSLAYTSIVVFKIIAIISGIFSACHAGESYDCAIYSQAGVLPIIMLLPIASAGICPIICSINGLRGIGEYRTIKKIRKDNRYKNTISSRKDSIRIVGILSMCMAVLTFLLCTFSDPIPPYLAQFFFKLISILWFVIGYRLLKRSMSPTKVKVSLCFVLTCSIVFMLNYAPVAVGVYFLPVVVLSIKGLCDLDVYKKWYAKNGRKPISSSKGNSSAKRRSKKSPTNGYYDDGL